MFPILISSLRADQRFFERILITSSLIGARRMCGWILVVFFSIDCCFTPYCGEMVPLLPAGMTGSNPGANDSDCRRGGLLNEPAYPPRKIRVCGRCGPAASSSWDCVKQLTKPADKRVRPQGPARTHQTGTSSSHISPTPETFVATATSAAAAEIRLHPRRDRRTEDSNEASVRYTSTSPSPSPELPLMLC